MGPEPDPNSHVPGMAIWGWMAPVELEWLGARAATMESVVEVGSLHGRSAFALLTACPGPVYCIDPWNDEADQSYPSFMGSCGHFPNLRTRRGYSPAVAAQVPDIDMCFIDGDHSYEAVVADLKAWMQKTTRLICGHDYYPGPAAGFPGVAQAVDEFFAVEAVKVAPDTAIWYVEL